MDSGTCSSICDWSFGSSESEIDLLSYSWVLLFTNSAGVKFRGLACTWYMWLGFSSINCLLPYYREGV